MTKPIIALVTDCDDTVAGDTTTKFLSHRGIDTAKFWGTEVKELLARGWDPSLAYLKRLIANVGKGKPLGEVTNQVLRDFGASLEDSLYPGVATLRADLQSIAAEIYPEITVEFYVISGGMKLVVENIPSLKATCNAVYGCEFEQDPTTGLICDLMRCVTFTEKTRYIFEINKGISPNNMNPYAVNTDQPENERRVPFKNMIYVGDGLTDIPSFSLVKARGGVSFGVFNPGQEASAQRALVEFLSTDRVASMHSPKYGKTDDLGALIRAAVTRMAKRIKAERTGVTDTGAVRLTPAD
ncbi:MAG: hypothetical protein K2W95_05760 [Candidatus Obscuribacterales bacterium]|nr:hypothetical protein [Candidatus Obscuribacterales bacterium]